MHPPVCKTNVQVFGDVPRSLLLLHTLRKNFPAEHVEEMLIISPPAEAAVLEVTSMRSREPNLARSAP